MSSHDFHSMHLVVSVLATDGNSFGKLFSKSINKVKWGFKHVLRVQQKFMKFENETIKVENTEKHGQTKMIWSLGNLKLGTLQK